MAQTRQVAVAFRGGGPHLARLLHGISDYAQQHGCWTLSFSPESLFVPLRNLRGWHGDGVLALLPNDAEVRAAKALRLPVVNLSGALATTGLPRVVADYRMIGCLAAEHLLERGFQRFGFYGLEDRWHSCERRDGFIGRLRKEGLGCSVLEVPSGFTTPRPWRFWVKPLQSWLPKLKPPVGILAVHDPRAALLVEACFALGLRVPDDVAVVGIDNDPLACEFARVPLTSVSRNDRRVGFEAAALLDRLMDGHPAPGHDVFIPPDGVVRRHSTDTLAIEDPEVKRLVRFVEENVNMPFGVERLEGMVSFSRRSLEQRFRACLRTTPYDYILRARVRRAEDLLISDDYRSLGHVAQSCGFADTRRFRLVFQQVTGTTPTKYRRHRLTDLQ
ncbi:MAG TPA: substrate-binding domain-containing protein [Verrucomicrobiae bacterium]|nr:substrate-binding domain-containing protein [Verrucomicrobiae bacterium]